MTHTPIHVTDDEFKAAVLNSPLPVIVDFWATWCVPCKVIAPALEKIAAEYAGKLVVAKVDTDHNPDWAGRMGVQGIPTLIFFANGKELRRHTGALPERNLRTTVDQFLVEAAAIG